MRRLMVLLSLVLLLAACGGKKTPTPASTNSAADTATSSSAQGSGSSSTDTSPVIADMFSLLVTEQDLTGGWQFLPTRPTLQTPYDPCNATSAPGTLIADQMQDQSATFLTQGTNGPFLVEQINRYDTISTASDILSKVSDALNCKSWTDTDSSGNQSKWTLGTLKVGKIGQKSVAVTTSLSDGSANVDVVYMQEGSYLVSVAYLSTDKPDASKIGDIAKKADAKVKQALSNATQ